MRRDESTSCIKEVMFALASTSLNAVTIRKLSFGFLTRKDGFKYSTETLRSSGHPIVLISQYFVEVQRAYPENTEVRYPYVAGEGQGYVYGSFELTNSAIVPIDCMVKYIIISFEYIVIVLAATVGQYFVWVY